MLGKSLLLCALVVVTSTANAQDLRYNAIVNDQGKIEIVPDDQRDGEPASKSDRGDQDGGVSINEIKGFVEEAKKGEIETYLQRGQNGEIQGVYQMSPALSAPSALLQGAPSGTSIQKVDWAGAGSWLPTDEELTMIAKDVGKRLMQSMRDTACDMDPRPTSVTPTVEMSVSLVVGTSMSVSALWEMERVCP